MSGGMQTADVYGDGFFRLRAKMAKCGYDLHHVYRNLRRCGSYRADEEAWSGRAKGPNGRSVEVFSDQTVTDLLRRGPLTITPETDKHGNPPKFIAPHTRFEVTREQVP